MSKSVKKIVADTFLDIANGLETGNFGSSPKIAITGLGSEHGEENVMQAAINAANKGVDVVYIGTLTNDKVKTIKTDDEKEAHKIMEQILDNKEVDGAVTMHFPFPIGVSTVGRVVTPAFGKQMFLATTTGTSSADRTTAMIKNTIYGIIAAKSCGINKPKVGILNIDGARQCEMALKDLKNAGYDIDFAESNRSDGGCIMRGNDILQGVPDVMVCDSLTGNILVKTLSAYTTGGSFEATGFGYGPGIGQDYNKLVGIVSRASGAPVISNAMQYLAQVVKGNIFDIAKLEFKKAEDAGLSSILDNLKPNSNPDSSNKEITAPPSEVVTEQIAGIEIMDLENAVTAL